MDKKKVKELALDTLTSIKEAMNSTNDAILSLTLANIASKIALLGVEVNKSDWVSVDDGLPDYEEDVLVCNEKEPSDIWFGHRTSDRRVVVDENEFAKGDGTITHWHKIDKLED